MLVARHLLRVKLLAGSNHNRAKFKGNIHYVRAAEEWMNQIARVNIMIGWMDE